jgi:hypothetical protein
VDDVFGLLFREYKDRFHCRIIAPNPAVQPIEVAMPMIRLDDQPMHDFVGTRWCHQYGPHLAEVSVMVQCAKPCCADFVCTNLTLLQLGIPFHYAILDNQERSQPSARFAKFVVMFPTLKFASQARLGALAKYCEIDKSKGAITLPRVMRSIAESIRSAPALLVVSLRLGGPATVLGVNATDVLGANAPDVLGANADEFDDDAFVSAVDTPDLSAVKTNAGRPMKRVVPPIIVKDDDLHWRPSATFVTDSKKSLDPITKAFTLTKPQRGAGVASATKRSSRVVKGTNGHPIEVLDNVIEENVQPPVAATK